MRPPGGRAWISFSKNREEINLNTKKENVKSSLFSDDLDSDDFPVFLQFMIDIQKFRRFAPIEIRFNDFGHFSSPETGKK